MNTYLLIGSGRLAHHLKFWFRSKEMELTSWDRTQDLSLLPRLTETSTHILLAINDNAIEQVYETYFAGQGKTVIHFSGAQSFKGIIGAHPLMTFSSKLYEEKFYDQINWTIEDDGVLKDFFPALPNSFINISADQKPLYHALCVAGGNLPQILWALVEKESSKIGISRKQWQSYWQKSLENSIQLGSSAVTGPFVRGDQATLEKNYQALKENAETLVQIFSGFMTAFKNNSTSPQVLLEREPCENNL